MTEKKYSLFEARAIARTFVNKFSEIEDLKIEVAGSIRREKPLVKDIEIVVEPAPALSLWGEPVSDEITKFDYVFARIVNDGNYKLEKNGPRYKKVIDIPSGIAIDLFICRPPAQFGCIFTIRTGPGDFSKWLVTSVMNGGAMPKHYGSGIIQRDGALWNDTFGEPLKLIPTPTEESYFAALGLDWIPPKDRVPMWGRK